MKRRFTLTLFSALTSASTFWYEAQAAASCPEATFDQVKSALSGNGEVELVFFASWCASCKEHLTETHAKNVVFIAAFDEQKRAEKVLDSFQVTSRCFTSDDSASTLSVRSLPAKLKYRF